MVPQPPPLRQEERWIALRLRWSKTWSRSAWIIAMLAVSPRARHGLEFDKLITRLNHAVPGKTIAPGASP
jgi:hypothetical protein